MSESQYLISLLIATVIAWGASCYYLEKLHNQHIAKMEIHYKKINYQENRFNYNLGAQHAYEHCTKNQEYVLSQLDSIINLSNK